MVFGMGGGNGVATPWTDPTLYFVRNASTGTQQMIGHAIGVPAGAFWGIDRGSAANVDALLRVITRSRASPSKRSASSRPTTTTATAPTSKALAFEATEQDVRIPPRLDRLQEGQAERARRPLPDLGARPLLHGVSDGVPVSPAAQAFVSVVSVPNIPQALLDAFIALEPRAVVRHVGQRASELGPLSTYSPPFQCGCYFEASPSVNGVGAIGRARPAARANDCTNPTRPACNLGYCEVQ